MIVSCPECGARYRLPDDAIPEEGRAMRCASCKHRWFEMGPEPEPLAFDERVPAPVRDAAVPEPAVPDLGPDATPDSAPAVVPETGPDPAPDHDDDDEPARGHAVGKSVLAVALGLAFTAGAAAMWVPASALPPLDLAQVPWLQAVLDPPPAPPNPVTLRFNAAPQPVSGGRVLYGVTGVLTNPTDEPQAAPALEGRLVDASGAVAYRWALRGGGELLLPGQQVAFDGSALGAPGERVVIAH